MKIAKTQSKSAIYGNKLAIYAYGSLLKAHSPKNSSSELLSFFNARICEFVGDCELAVKDAIYQELSKKL